MITISPGHFGKGTGAHGYIDEGEENIKVAKEVVKKLRAAGITTNYIEDVINKDKTANVNWLKIQHNKTARDIDVSIHFNASSGMTEQPIGTEVLVYDSSKLTNAQLIVDGITSVSKLTNRGVKYRTDLGILKTNKPAYLIEVCFVNSKTDTSLYVKHFDDICNSIAKSLAKIVGKDIGEEVDKVTGSSKRTLDINSASLVKISDEILTSRAQREIIVDAAVKNGMSKSWREKLDNKTITNDEILVLAAKTIVELNK